MLLLASGTGIRNKIRIVPMVITIDATLRYSTEFMLTCKYLSFDKSLFISYFLFLITQPTNSGLRRFCIYLPNMFSRWGTESDFRVSRCV